MRHGENLTAIGITGCTIIAYHGVSYITSCLNGGYHNIGSSVEQWSTPFWGRHGAYKNILWILSLFFIFILSWSLFFFSSRSYSHSFFLKTLSLRDCIQWIFFLHKVGCVICLICLKILCLFNFFIFICCFYHCSPVSKILWCLFCATDNIDWTKQHFSLIPLSDDFCSFISPSLHSGSEALL